MIPCPYILYTHSHSPTFIGTQLLEQGGCDTCHSYLKVSKGKRRTIMETQIFHHPKIKSSKKILQNKNQNPSRYYN
jgi:hypothetical protein